MKNKLLINAIIITSYFYAIGIIAATPQKNHITSYLNDEQLMKNISFSFFMSLPYLDHSFTERDLQYLMDISEKQGDKVLNQHSIFMEHSRKICKELEDTASFQTESEQVSFLVNAIEHMEKEMENVERTFYKNALLGLSTDGHKVMQYQIFPELLRQKKSGEQYAQSERFSGFIRKQPTGFISSYQETVCEEVNSYPIGTKFEAVRDTDKGQQQMNNGDIQNIIATSFTIQPIK